MNIIKNLSVFPFILPVFLAFSFLFFSCSARIDGTVKDGGEAAFTFKTNLEPVTLNLLRKMSNFFGENSGPVLDGTAIENSLKSAPGVKTARVRNAGPESLDGSVSISDVNDFLAFQFISYKEGAGASSLAIALSKESAPEIVSLLSPDVCEYLEALMAPAVVPEALGEGITKLEYLDLVSSVYGRPLANEIAAASFIAYIEFPRALKGVKGGIGRGKTAEINIPLIDILVLEEPLFYTFSW